MNDWQSVTFTVPAELKERLGKVARDRMTSTSAIIREVLAQHLVPTHGVSAAPAQSTMPKPEGTK